VITETGVGMALAGGSLAERRGFGRTVALADGGEVLVREATPGDAEGLRGMFARCSPETIYLRFQLPVPTVPEWAIGLLVGAAERGGRAIVALVGGEIVGHAMYARYDEDGREAEVAVVVEDGWRSLGLGALLLSEIAEGARRDAVEALTCTTLGENRGILELVRRVLPNARTSFGGGACVIRASFGR
jgi:GNAT superfamily N-acetyltransferase